MVSDAQQKKADNTKKQNADAKAKSDAAQSAAKSNRDANRGYNSSQTGVQGRNRPSDSKLGNSNLTDSQGREYNAQVSQGIRTGILTVAEADGIMRANRGEGFRSNSSGGSYGNPNADYGQRNQRNTPQSKSNLAASQSDLAQARKELAAASTPEERAKQEARIASYGTLNNLPRDQRIALGIDSEYNDPYYKAQSKVAALESKVGLYEATNRYVPVANPIPSYRGRSDGDVRFEASGVNPVMYVPKSELKSTVTTTYADGTTKDRTFSYNNAERFIVRQGGITPIEGSIADKQVQGPVKPTIVIPTMGGKNQTVDVSGTNYTVDGKVFATEKEANDYIKRENDKLPFTDPKSILYPITEPLYKYIDKSAKYNFNRLEKNGNDFETKVMSAAISFQGSMLSGFQNIREQVQTKILQKPPTPTRQISSIPTLESKGLESATEGVGVQWTYPFVTGVDVNPLSEKNPVSKYYQGAAEQWGKQTLTENAAQLLVMGPVVAFDIATLGEGGLAAGRVATRVVTKIASPIITKTVSKEIFLGGLRQGVGITRKVQLHTGKFDYVKSGTIDSPVQSRGTYGNLAKKNYLDNIDFNIKPTKLKTNVDPYVSGTVSIPTKGTYGNLAKKNYLDNIDFNIKPTKLKTNVDPYVSGTVDSPVINRGSYGNLAKKNYLDNIDFNYPKLSQFQSTEISLGSGERIGKSRILKGVGFVSVITPSQGFLSKIVNLGLGGAKKEKIEQVFYHGTTPESGIAIVKSQGFDFGKSKTSSGTMFAASSKDMAYGEMGSLLKITMKKGAKSIRADLAPKIVRQNPIEGWNIIRDKSKAFGFDIIENMKSPKYEGREIELLSNKNIKSIEETILNVKKPQTLSELAAVKASKLGSPFSQEKEIDGFIDIGGKPNPITLSDLAATKASKVTSPFNANTFTSDAVPLGVGKAGQTKIEQIFYHGTTPEIAKNILESGFDFGKSKTSSGTMFAASDTTGAYGHKGALLKITMKKEATSFDVNQQKNPLMDDDKLRKSAKKQDKDIIENMMQGIPDIGREVEITSSKNIKKIELIEGSTDPNAKPGKTEYLSIPNPPKFIEKQTAPQTLLLKEKEVEKITPVQLSMFHSYGIKLGAGKVVAPARTTPPRPSIQPRVVTTSLPKEKTTQMSVTRTNTPQILLSVPKQPRTVRQSMRPVTTSRNQPSQILIPKQVEFQIQPNAQILKQTPKQTPKQTTRQPPIVPTPQKLRNILKTEPVPILKQKITNLPPPRIIPALLPPPVKKGFTPKKKKSKQNDFLGNTKLDSIEGLFRRSTIIHGDKRISKQVKKDRKAKFKERGVSFFSKR